MDKITQTFAHNDNRDQSIDALFHFALSTVIHWFIRSFNYWHVH